MKDGRANLNSLQDSRQHQLGRYGGELREASATVSDGRIKAKVNFLLSKVEEFKIQHSKKEEKAQHSKRKANEVAKVVWKIQDYIGNLGEVVNKA